MTNNEKKEKVLDVFNKIAMNDMKAVIEGVKAFSQEDFDKLKSLFLANSVIAGSSKMTEYFIAHGANVNHQVGEKSLLEIAEDKDFKKVCSLLKAYGAKKVEHKEEITQSQLLKDRLCPPKPKPKFAR